MDRVPEVLDAMMESSAIKNKSSNVAMVLQSVGFLTDRLEVEDRTKNSEAPTTDIDQMRVEIERMRQSRPVQ